MCRMCLQIRLVPLHQLLGCCQFLRLLLELATCSVHSVEQHATSRLWQHAGLWGAIEGLCTQRVAEWLPQARQTASPPWAASSDRSPPHSLFKATEVHHVENAAHRKKLSQISDVRPHSCKSLHLACFCRSPAKRLRSHSQWYNQRPGRSCSPRPASTDFEVCISFAMACSMLERNSM